MPYIPEYKRNHFGDIAKRIESLPMLLPGEMNYLFTIILRKYLRNHGESYDTYNAMVGALECCKLELYRRKIKPYEYKKINENGDVW